jgi:photosystem II stability/assembly factor-like uncharacterized protein
MASADTAAQGTVETLERHDTGPIETAAPLPPPAAPSAAAAPSISASDNASFRTASPPRAAAPGLAAFDRARSARIEVPSPDPAVRWGIEAGAVRKTVDGGLTWKPVSSNLLATSTIHAGAAPSQTTCWLVGGGGLVLVTVDGDSWKRVGFPETSDLRSVVAAGASSAIVTTADGRRFETTDGGATWTLVAAR